MVGAALRDTPDLPTHHPAIERLLFDDDGFLWVLRGGFDPTAHEWDVIDPDGRFLGSLTVPDLNLMYVGERWIAGVTRDELDVPTVVVLPLDRSGAEAVSLGTATSADYLPRRPRLSRPRCSPLNV